LSSAAPASGSLRIVFAGTPEFAARALEALSQHRDEYSLCAVYTQPDRPAGRGRQPQPSAVKELALGKGMAVHQPASLRDPQAQQELAALAPDLMIVAAYGLILPRPVLDIPRLGCINVHASLLPRWRGAAPIERAIEAGDEKTGITIMQMDAGLDTGDMLLRLDCEISPTDTGATLRDRLGELGAQAVIEALRLIRAGKLVATPQDASLATYAAKLRREEAEIDWHQDASVLARRIRAFNPANVCQSSVAGQVLRIWMAAASNEATGEARPGEILRLERNAIVVACGSGALQLVQLQLAGGKMLDARALLNGRADLFRPGSCLGPTISA